MKRTDSLFDLIHSLTKEEKRHFQIYVKKYSRSPKYLLLFDALSEMHDYDKSELDTRLRASKFSSRLNVAKEYLYLLILRSLRDLEPTSPSAIVLQQIADISQLVNRKLFSQAKKTIKKAKALALSHDLFGEFNIILDLEGYLPDADRTVLFKYLEEHLRRTN
ncbi:MAG: hypothetical protein ABI778_12135, partial [Ignavibacteriota bacterium]